jgi:alpha-L-fucosidase
MKEMGEWLATNGQTVYATEAGDVKPQEWGCTTRKGDCLFVHIFELEQDAIYLPLECKVVEAKEFGTNKPVKFQKVSGGILLECGQVSDSTDYIVELRTK